MLFQMGQSSAAKFRRHVSPPHPGSFTPGQRFLRSDKIGHCFGGDTTRPLEGPLRFWQRSSSCKRCRTRRRPSRQLDCPRCTSTIRGKCRAIKICRNGAYMTHSQASCGRSQPPGCSLCCPAPVLSQPGVIAENKLMQKAATTNPRAVSVRTGKQRGGCSSPYKQIECHLD